MVVNDANATIRDAFVRDRKLGTTTLVSRSYNAGGIDQAATSVTISADGNWIAYTSYATNIVPGDTNKVKDVFLFDRVNTTTRRVNVGPGGREANGGSQNPSLSRDGTWVVFDSGATNLVIGGSSLRLEVYGYNRFAQFAQRLTQRPDGSAFDNGSGLRFSGGAVAGNLVLFDTLATDMVANHAEGASDAVVYDLQAKTFRRFAYTPWGTPAGTYNGVFANDGSAALFLAEEKILPTYPMSGGNLVVYTVHPKIEAANEPRLGRPLRFALEDPRAAGRTYVAMTALSYLPAIRIDHRDLFLSADPVLFASMSVQSVFQNYVGQLDAQGRGTATLLLPYDPALRGLTLWTAFVALDATARSGIGAISNSVSTTFER
ncbi:MAG: PD40 domain-containing protein [Planctomycetes bacterium]|nr:PD40 domain-containing protein [Planctomycetota bacterium]